MIKILVVDDSALMRKLIGQIFADAAGFRGRVRAQRQGSAGVDSPTSMPDVVTLDIHMPEMDGLACLDRIMIERRVR